MVIGAAGGIGKPLCGFLTRSDFVSKLILCDIANTKGMAMELNHMDQGVVVESKTVEDCDADVDCVMMPCGKPQTSADEKRDDLFKFNAKIFQSSVDSIIKRCKKTPVFIIVGNPINSITVVVAETLKKAGKYDPKKLFGLNELDALRAQRLVADLKGFPPRDIHVPFIGGHSEKTITPVLSKVTNVKSSKPISLSKEEQEKIFDQVRFAGDRVLEAYENRGTAVISTAYAIFRLSEALYTDKHKDLTYYSYTEHGQMKDKLPQFMTAPIKLGNGQIESFLPLEELVEAIDPEIKSKVLEELQRNIQLALDTFKTISS